MTVPDTLWRLEQASLGQRLREVSLRIGPGVTAVLGQSGAGKTSLLNLLVAFERPDAGTVTATLERGAHRRPLFWVPQGDGLWPHLSARQHLVETGSGEADALLAEFGLTERAAALPETLSQGERARLAVARALAADSAVLVMDEPLAHVAPGRAGDYWAVVRRRAQAASVSLVFATHAPGTVLAEAEHVICLDEGRVVYAGGVEELYWRPPSAELAVCLGEANWFEPADAWLWLLREEPGPRCLRPEQLLVAPAPDGRLLVEAARFHGAVAEVQLRDPATGAVRRFWHRPAGNHLSPGTRVNLETRQ